MVAQTPERPFIVLANILITLPKTWLTSWLTWLNWDQQVTLDMGIITYFDLIQSLLGFPGGAVVKNPPSHAGDVEDWVRSLGLEDLLAEGMATHSNILAWRIPWTEEPVRLQSRGLQRVRYNWRTKHTHTQSLLILTSHRFQSLNSDNVHQVREH